MSLKPLLIGQTAASSSCCLFQTQFKKRSGWGKSTMGGASPPWEGHNRGRSESVAQILNHRGNYSNELNDNIQ